MNMLTLFAQASDDYLAPYLESSTTTDPTLADITIDATIVLTTILIIFFSWLITAYLLSRIFKKAGAASWQAYVPVLSNWRFLELGGQKGFMSLVTFIPVVGIIGTVYYYIAMYNVGLKLGKDTGYVFLGVFLPLIWFIVLAFDKSTWNDMAGAPSLTTINPTMSPQTAQPMQPMQAPLSPQQPQMPQYPQPQPQSSFPTQPVQPVQPVPQAPQQPQPPQNPQPPFPPTTPPPIV